MIGVYLRILQAGEGDRTVLRVTGSGLTFQCPGGQVFSFMILELK